MAVILDPSGLDLQSVPSILPLLPGTEAPGRPEGGRCMQKWRGVEGETGGPLSQVSQPSLELAWFQTWSARLGSTRLVA